MIHAFAGSYEEAREYIRLGFRLGLGGAATWPQALRLHRTLPRLPLDSIVLETDSPDMAPAMFAGQRNSPEHLPEIAEALAELMGLEAEVLAEASSRNACELLAGSAGPFAGKEYKRPALDPERPDQALQLHHLRRKHPAGILGLASTLGGILRRPVDRDDVAVDVMGHRRLLLHRCGYLLVLLDDTPTAPRMLPSACCT